MSELKWRRVLEALVQGQRLTRFDAERIGDHCLNSTISDLSRKGVVIYREPIELPGRFGMIKCLRYRIEPEDLDRAKQILGVP